MLVPGVIMLIVGFAASYTYLEVYTANFYGEVASTLTKVMFYLSGAVLSFLGGMVYTNKKLLSEPHGVRKRVFCLNFVAISRIFA